MDSDGTGRRDQLGYHFVCEAALRELIRGQKHASALRDEDEKTLHYGKNGGRCMRERRKLKEGKGRGLKGKLSKAGIHECWDATSSR